MEKFTSNNTGIDNFVKNNSDATVARFGHLNAIVDNLNQIGSNYKIYTAVLFQEGEDNPVATVLTNTLGVDISWVRNSEGEYQGYPSIEIFSEEKTFISVSVNIAVISESINVTSGYRDGTSYLRVNSYDSGVSADFNGKLYIEVKVYNN